MANETDDSCPSTNVAKTAVYFYISSQHLSTADVEKILNVKSGTIVKPGRYVWWCQSHWYSDEDIALPLKQFTHDWLSKHSQSIESLVVDYDVSMKLDLVIGISNFDKQNIPVIDLPNATLRVLGKWPIDVEVHLDNQI